MSIFVRKQLEMMALKFKFEERKETQEGKKKLKRHKVVIKTWQ